MFGLHEARHQFQQNPLCDRGVAAEDQRLESCTDFGMTGGTQGMDPHGRVNEIHAGSVCAVAVEAVRASGRGESYRAHPRASVTDPGGSPFVDWLRRYL